MNSDSDTEFSRRFGRGMVFLAWIVVIGLLTLFFSHWQDTQENPNRHLESQVTADGARQVTLLRNRYGHYVADGTINGQRVVFMLDTGATTVSVPQGVARRLGLRAGAPLPVSTANGTATVYATHLDSVGLGDIIVSNVRADINPNMNGNIVLLGMNVLKHLDLDQRGDKLTLRQDTE